MKEPSLYTSLKRLESQGFVESYWGDETQGARRKYYRVTEEGMRELVEATKRWVRGAQHYRSAAQPGWRRPMNELRMYVEHLFEGKVLTAENIELKEEIYGNLVARYGGLRG